MITTVDEVHAIILRTASEIANQRWIETGGQVSEAPSYGAGERFNAAARRRRNPHRRVTGEIFRPDPAQSEIGGLALSVDPLVTSTMTDEEIEELHEVGFYAVRDAIKQHPHLLVGLILGEARQGRSYFDRFTNG
jgi:hypothetical protein